MTSTLPVVRPAALADVGKMHRIRLSVSENRLTDPARVTEHSYAPFIATGGAWVAERCRDILGFAIIDATDRNVWALFVEPRAEGQGIGRALHDRMVDWSRDHKLERLSLTTAPGTRADQFYRAQGWSEVGVAANGDLRFERDL